MVMSQKELADMLGVSQMTVSRALNNHPHVNEKVRARILETARQHGYSLEANHAAEMLRRRGRGEPATTHILCAMMHIPQEANDEESFQGRILKGISERSREINWEVVLPITSRHGIPLIVARKQVDGVLRLLRQHEADTAPTSLPIPWVSLLHDIPNHDVVTVDNLAGGRAIGAFLLEQRHRNAAYIGPDSRIGRQRLDGLRQAFRAAGSDLPDERVCLLPDAGNEITTRTLVESLLQKTGFSASHHPFTVLAAYNDYMAVAAMRCLTAKGIRVPDDLSLTGFDGAVPRGFRGARVTTVTIPLERMGVESVRLLERRFETPDAPPQRLVLETELLPGETTRPLSPH
jgi:DNA-binding LacI/PurR family transcriptional regulator